MRVYYGLNVRPSVTGPAGSAPGRNLAPQAGGLKHQLLIFSWLQRLEIQFESKVLAGFACSEAPLLGLSAAVFFLCPHMAFPL